MRTDRARLILVLAAALLAACDATAPSGTATGTAIGSPTAAASAGAPSASPASSAGRSEAPSSSAAGSPRPSGSAASSARPSGSAGNLPAPTGSIDPGTCAGSDANRQFFRDVAAQVTWDVYCPTLPKSWFVEAGTFRAANGGSMVISYKNGSGQRIELKEGAACTGAGAECPPLDASIGSAAFGDLLGTLGNLAGGFALYVRLGSNPAWSATSSGLDETGFRAICIGLLKVAG